MTGYGIYRRYSYGIRKRDPVDRQARSQLMLNKELVLLIHRDREREIEEALRVRSLLDGRQPDKRRVRVPSLATGGGSAPQPLVARPR
jgi:hypothetical protein